MESSDGTSDFNEKRTSEKTSPANELKRPTESNTNTNTSIFINHAAIAWQESRRKWIGDTSKRSQRMPKDPIISWSMTYEDVLSTKDPFSEPIPLPEMVDFLVDIWEDEGLFN